MKIVWTERARLELTDLFMYVKDNFGSQTAIKVRNKIRTDILLLKDQPYLGKLEPLLIHRMVSYRFLISGYYKIIYYVESDTIYISALWDCRQSPEKITKKIL